MHSIPRTWKRVFAGALAVGAMAVLLAPKVAQAHFVLSEPPAWMSQDALGLPEKTGPCGDEYDDSGLATPTNIVTAYRQGQTITVTINETIFHPGHYRIALATDRSELPADPVVTAGVTVGTTVSSPCGNAPIQSPPVFPVLADGVFAHSTAFTSPQTLQVTLPSNISCTKCTLQVIEFMGNHTLENPNGCFYHHCADLSIHAPADGGTVKVDSGEGNADARAATGGGDASSAATGGGDASSAATGSGNAPESEAGTVVAKGSSSSGCSFARGRGTSGVVAIGGVGAWAIMLRRRPRRRGRR